MHKRSHNIFTRASIKRYMKSRNTSTPCLHATWEATWCKWHLLRLNFNFVDNLPAFIAKTGWYNQRVKTKIQSLRWQYWSGEFMWLLLRTTLGEHHVHEGVCKGLLGISWHLTLWFNSDSKATMRLKPLPHFMSTVFHHLISLAVRNLGSIPQKNHRWL